MSNIPPKIIKLLKTFLIKNKGPGVKLARLNDGLVIATQNPITNTIYAQQKREHGLETVWLWQNRNGRRNWLYMATERPNGEIVVSEPPFFIPPPITRIGVNPNPDPNQEALAKQSPE